VTADQASHLVIGVIILTVLAFIEWRACIAVILGGIVLIVLYVGLHFIFKAMGFS
jgi:glucose uptake protein GlcU